MKKFENIVLELSKINKKKGRYIRTWSNGNEEYSSDYYDIKEIEAIINKAKKTIKEKYI